jgi:hypothetical protein
LFDVERKRCEHKGCGSQEGNLAKTQGSFALGDRPRPELGRVRATSCRARHTVLAKSVTSIAVLTGERLSLGVGTSPWPEDFRVTFQDWETRGKRMDEMIEIIRGLTTGDFYEFPARPIPILIGGHSDAALRRAAHHGDGWMFAGGSIEDLAGCVERLKLFRKECGRESAPFEIHASSLHAYQLDGVRQLEDLGVTDLVIGFRNPYTRSQDKQPLVEKIELLQNYAANIISKY